MFVGEVRRVADERTAYCMRERCSEKTLKTEDPENTNYPTSCSGDRRRHVAVVVGFENNLSHVISIKFLSESRYVFISRSVTQCRGKQVLPLRSRWIFFNEGI
jgi:hypothetical protein